MENIEPNTKKDAAASIVTVFTLLGSHKSLAVGSWCEAPKKFILNTIDENPKLTMVEHKTAVFRSRAVILENKRPIQFRKIPKKAKL